MKKKHTTTTTKNMLHYKAQSEGIGEISAAMFLQIQTYITLVQYFQSVYRNEDIYELKGVHIANFEVDIFQAVFNIVVYQMLIVTNVPVNSAVL